MKTIIDIPYFVHTLITYATRTKTNERPPHSKATLYISVTSLVKLEQWSIHIDFPCLSCEKNGGKSERGGKNLGKCCNLQEKPKKSQVFCCTHKCHPYLNVEHVKQFSFSWRDAWIPSKWLSNNDNNIGLSAVDISTQLTYHQHLSHAHSQLALNDRAGESVPNWKLINFVKEYEKRAQQYNWKIHNKNGLKDVLLQWNTEVQIQFVHILDE